MRVIVAEDNYTRDAIADVLGAPPYGMDVIGRASTIADLLRLVDADPPDIVTLDLRMPRVDPLAKPELAGMDAARQIRRAHPGVAILVLSQFDYVPWVEEVVKLGMAVGYQLKDELRDIGRLAEVMRAVAAGEIRIDSTLVARLVSRPRPDDPLDRLTRREREVLGLMAEGLSNAGIAARLVIEHGSVEAHATEIYRKLGISHLGGEVNARVMAVLAFLRSGKAPGFEVSAEAV